MPSIGMEIDEYDTLYLLPKLAGEVDAHHPLFANKVIIFTVKTPSITDSNGASIFASNDDETASLSQNINIENYDAKKAIIIDWINPILKKTMNV